MTAFLDNELELEEILVELTKAQKEMDRYDALAILGVNEHIIHNYQQMKKVYDTRNRIWDKYDISCRKVDSKAS